MTVMTDGSLPFFAAILLLCSIPLVVMMVFTLGAVCLAKLMDVVLTYVVEPGLDRIPHLSWGPEPIQEPAPAWKPTFTRWRLTFLWWRPKRAD